MDPRLLSSACQFFATTPEKLIPLSGGHYNAVYQFPFGDQSAILRIGVEDCPPEQTLAMLEWVSYLAQHAAPVTAPLPSIQGHIMESLEFDGSRYTLTAFVKADGVLAENIPVSDWSDDLFNAIGKAIGKFHRISSSYSIANQPNIRPYWFDSYEIHEALRVLTHSSDPAHELLPSLISDLGQLPTSPLDFGLIHGDLHFANFLVRPDSQISIIDFDDCVYGWFPMDVSMALFDVLVLYNAKSAEDNQRFASRFFSNYLSGYRQEFDLSEFWLSQIPRFLKLKELSIYASLIDHPDANHPGTWVGNFMHNRASRIANNQSYGDIGFVTG